MKRTCLGCKALESYRYCELGYPIKSGYPKNDNIFPILQCPKPITYQQYIDAPKYH